MQPENFDVAHQQSSVFDRRDDLGDGGNVAARENILRDPGAGHVGTGRAADRMQHHHTVIAEQFGAPPKEFFVKAHADMLEHADGHDPVELPGNVAIVAQ